MKSKLIMGIMLTLLLLIGMLTLAFNIQPVKAESLSLISLNPSEYTAQVGDVFTIAVNVFNVENYYGCDFWLYYRKGILNATTVGIHGPGSIVDILGLTSAMYSLFWRVDSHNMTHDVIKFSCVFMYSEIAKVYTPPHSFNGSGVIGWITFEGLMEGVSALSFDSYWTALYDSNAQKIPMEPPVDGSVTVVPPPPPPPPTPPIAHFIWHPIFPFVGDEVICVDTSAPNGGEIIAWKWEVDGPATPLTPMNEREMRFHADDFGTVNVTLTVWDTEGLTDTTWHTIEVHLILLPIVIWANGSVYPPHAPISSVNNITYTITGYDVVYIFIVDNETYTFTKNIKDCIVEVERDNIVVDGAGYTVAGIGLSYRSNVTIKNMEIRYGVFLLNSSNNIIYHNNFDMRARLYTENSVNIWDDGYPSGGNYWSDYTGVDYYSGPNQDQPGSDGIGDTPYIIDANNRDRYPLMKPWTPTPPTPPPKFSLGDWVRTTANLNVREGPGLSYTIISTMPLGTIGQIVGGPVEADGFVWWDVDYVVGVRGWSAQNWLELATPPQPVNLSPPDGATDVSLTPQLLSSPPLQDVPKELIPWEEIDGFYVTRVDSQWQITTIHGDYSNPVYDYTLTGGLIDRRFFPELPGVWSGGFVPPGVLDYGTTYYWRVRHRDFRGVWSPWSNETSFTTKREELYFAFTPQKSIVGEIVTFNTPPYEWIVSYEWNFGDGSPPAHGLTVNHSYSEANIYTVTLTVTNDEGVTASTFRTLRVTKDWTFAIITDLHIGYCEEDYGTSGWDDSGVQEKDPWLTNRLRGIVDWINAYHWLYSIHFVVVLGDISDTAERSEFLKAREILNNLVIPYIPVIGNHDIWPYIQEANRSCWRDVRPGCIKDWPKPIAVGDQFFEEVFWQQNDENVNKLKELFGMSWKRQEEQEGYEGAPYLQNYAFTYKGVKFIALDFVDRQPTRPPESGGAVLHYATKKWLEDKLAEDPAMPTIFLSHHPMFVDWVARDVGFNVPDALEIRDIVKDKNVLRNFAGHNHRTAETTGSVTGIYVVTTEAVCRESCALTPGITREGDNIRLVNMGLGEINRYDVLIDIDPGRLWDKNQDFLERKCYWYALAKSPVDLIVTDPDGFTLTKEIGEVAGMFYLEFDIDGDGELDDFILSDQLKEGNYRITVVPHEEASPTDTYTLAVGGLDSMTVLAENVPLSDIPGEPYIVNSATLALNISPSTLLNVSEPKFVVDDATYLTSITPITLVAEDNPDGSGVTLTAYRIYNATYDSGWMYTEPFYLTGLSDGTYHIDFNSTDYAGNVEQTNIVTVILDDTPPSTTITAGEPKYATDVTYVTSETSFTLEAIDGVGSGVYSIAYRIYNGSYDSGWLPYTAPFYLKALADGVYTIEFSSTDNLGNVEPTNIVTVVLDNTGPSVAILNPPAGWALQDGVTFIADVTDVGSGVSFVSFSIREANGEEGKPVGFEDLPAMYNATTGKWTLFFNTLQLPDGYYVVLVKAEDNLGNIGFITVPYSIRNWAVIELLPASETNKAGRTMPVKFALRVASSVDPNQPFVYNEDLTIKIYATNDPSNILQTSTFGDTARDYRINTVNQLYITNFQTLKTPMQYTVSVYRGIFLIDSFNFSTVK